MSQFSLKCHNANVTLISLQKSAEPTAINFTSIDPGLMFVTKRTASSHPKRCSQLGRVCNFSHTLTALSIAVFSLVKHDVTTLKYVGPIR